NQPAVPVKDTSVWIQGLCAQQGAGKDGITQEIKSRAHQPAAQDAAKNAQGVRLTAISNDGYSESYGAAGNAASDGAQIKSVVYRWLSGTGLVSAL
ncbi:MAG: hypothetical protein IKL84_05375, partial [Clostridia bacterium]|nr:hypothetical protein [Clostridia bacterium]